MSPTQYLIEYNRYMNFIGIGAVILIAFVFSKSRSKVNWMLVLKALAMQFAIGFFALKTNVGGSVLKAMGNVVQNVYKFADAGSQFLFGNLTEQFFAFKVLPIIIFFGALMALLFHFGIVQQVVSVCNFLIRPILGTTGTETLCAVSNSFLGQTEAPLLIKNYLKKITKSEMFVVMVSGMATISGAILAVYASFGVPIKHLLASSVMAIPASILIAKIIMPETEEQKVGNQIKMEAPSGNMLGAIATGTSDGLQLALNVGAMLIVFISLIAMVNHILALFNPTLNLNVIFGYLFYPFAYFLGFNGVETEKIAELLGTKVAINEFIAFTDMVKMNLSPRAQDIVTYALCGFSNFSCIGIQIGGIGALVPERREWLTQLGVWAVFASSLANLLSALIAGILL